MACARPERCVTSEARLAGPVPPVVPESRRRVRLYHQLPRVLHGAGRQQPGHGVSQALERNYS